MQIITSDTTATRLVIIRKMRELEWTDASPIHQIISASINLLQGAVLCETPEIPSFTTLSSILNNPSLANTLDTDKRAALADLLAQYQPMLPATSRYTSEQFAVLENNAELEAGDPRLDEEIKDITEADFDDVVLDNAITVDSDNVAFLDAIRSELDEIETIVEFNLDSPSDTLETFTEEDVADISNVVATAPVSMPASISFQNKYVRPAINNVIASVSRTAKQSVSFSSYMNQYFDKHAGLLTGLITGMVLGVMVAMIFPPVLPVVTAIFIKGSLGAVANLGGLGILVAAASAVSTLIGLTADYFRNKSAAKKETKVNAEKISVVQQTKKPLSTFAKVANELTLASHYPVDENIHQDPGFDKEDRGLVFANSMFNQPLTSFDREPEKILVRNFRR